MTDEGTEVRGVLSRWIREAEAKGLIVDGSLSTVRMGLANDLLFASSLQERAGDTLVLVKTGCGTRLLVMGSNGFGFQGTALRAGASTVWFCALDRENGSRLRRCLPFAVPSPVGNFEVTFGVGDRLGLATPGHIRIMKRFRVAPVLAQQSIRELELTGRSYGDVIDSATWAVFQEGYTLPWGADGDHLKTTDWVSRAVRAGCTLITADLSDHLDTGFATASAGDVQDAYEKLEAPYRNMISTAYEGSRLKVDTGDIIDFPAEELSRCALVYGRAVAHAARMYEAGRETGMPFDFEVSIDETGIPTTFAAHVFVAGELRRSGVPFRSLAPRFIGEFQKGVDYGGDRRGFESSLRVHAAIARKLGHRLSIHSGSDKFSIFPVIGRATARRFHLKTSGTNWLQALLVVSRLDPSFFRVLYKSARVAFPVARTYYHVTPDLSRTSDIDAIGDGELPGIFDNPDDRQVLHISYGEILKDQELREKLFELLHDNIEVYWESLAEHIGKHLELLGVPKR
jgi:hypothetical protein